MATLKQSIELDAVKLGERMTLTIQLRRMRELRWRVNVVMFLLRLVEWIAPFDVVINSGAKKPWIFYCPYCNAETSGEILCSGLFVQNCQECKRAFLAFSYDGGNKAYAVQAPHCIQGCHYAEPFGWVISADCTLHDGIPG